VSSPAAPLAVGLGPGAPAVSAAAIQHAVGFPPGDLGASLSAGHHAPGFDPGLLALLPILLAAALYLGAARAERLRATRDWPAIRTVSWMLGLLIVAACFVGPLADAAHTGFVAHMFVHLVAAMVAPLLLVLAAPVTLALRTLEVGQARRLSRLLRSPVARVVAHPVTASVLNVGSLWLLFATPFGHALLEAPALHPLLTAHFVAAGFLFAAAFVGPDPAPHRPGFGWRLVILLPALGLHSVLAKLVAADPPAGVTASDALAGAQLMYYGGGLAELALLILFFAGWFRASDPARRRTPAGVSVSL